MRDSPRRSIPYVPVVDVGTYGYLIDTRNCRDASANSRLFSSCMLSSPRDPTAAAIAPTTHRFEHNFAFASRSPTCHANESKKKSPINFERAELSFSPIVAVAFQLVDPAVWRVRPPLDEYMHENQRPFPVSGTIKKWRHIKILENGSLLSGKPLSRRLINVLRRISSHNNECWERWAEKKKLSLPTITGEQVRKLTIK